MKHLLRDLENLSRDILQMGSLVERAIDRATTALTDRRSDLAQEVLASDLEMDRKEIAIEEECLKILALHQPVGSDLRFVVSVMKVNNDLERMGDLATNVAERAAYLATHEPIGVPLDFNRMVDAVRDMVRDSLQALVERDSARARDVCARDDEVDDFNREMFVVLQALMHDHPDTVKRAVHTLSASRHLERIADLATNIAEDVVFMVDGEIIRHRTEDYGEGQTTRGS